MMSARFFLTSYHGRVHTLGAVWPGQLAAGQVAAGVRRCFYVRLID